MIHDFWVPAWRLKIDAVPGITTHYRVTPNRLGTYPVVCAELCGLGHAFMRQTAHVLTAREVRRLARQAGRRPARRGRRRRRARAPARDTAAAKQVFDRRGCAGCHALADAGSYGATGPSLDEVLAGQDADAIRESIVEPSAKIAEGFQDGHHADELRRHLCPRSSTRW